MQSNSPRHISLPNFIEIMPDAIIVVNEGNIALINHQAETLFGYTREMLIGQKVEHLISDYYLPKDEEHRLIYFIHHQVSQMGEASSLYGKHKDGHEFPIEISLSSFETEDGLLALVTVRDITDRKKIEDAKAMLSAIVEYSNDAIIGKDLKGMIFSWNKGAENLYGYTESEMIGKSITVLHPSSQSEEFSAIMRKIQADHPVKHAETLRICKDGRVIPVSLTVSPIKNSNGKIIGASATARDITEQKKLEALLKNKNIELENANLAKDRFLASMSHELRTPLNAIMGFSSALLMKLTGRINHEQENQLKIIQRNGNHLLSLINDLLDLAKIDSGKVILTIEEISCQKCIQEVAITLRSLAEEKNLKFTVQLPDKEIKVLSDKRILTQIFINIINNAIKYTEKGGITIKLIKKKFKAGDKIIISVVDTGVGIKPENCKKLFQAFHRVLTSDQKQEGTGLGLHVTKKLADLIHATIELKSEFGTGTEFYIKLPFSFEK